MNKVEGILLWISLFLYLIGFFLFLSSWVYKINWNRRATYVTVAGFVLYTGSMIVRWYISGHPPVQGNYENALLGSWFLILVFLGSSIKMPRLIPFGALINPIAIMIVGLGLRTPTQAEALTAPYQSNWLWIHVSFAWLAFGGFFIAFAIGIIYLIKSYRRPTVDKDYLTKLEDLILAHIIFGFVAQTFMIGSGAVWAATLWGSYWSWDPVETGSLISWLAYGIIIHLRMTRNWRQKRLAWMSVFGIVTMIVLFWGLGIGKGIHTPLM